MLKAPLPCRQGPRRTREMGSHFIRRNTDGVIAENQGKARPPGDLRVALFPSKHSRVRIPSPALEAECGPARPPTRRPTSRVHPFFGGSEHTLWPFHFPRFVSPSATSCSRVRSSDTHRPRQEIGQRTPEGIVSRPVRSRRGRLITVLVLYGLHHDYRRAV